MFEQEEWAAVVGFEGLYEVSNLGRVRGIDRRNNGRKVKGVMLKIQTHRKRRKVGLHDMKVWDKSVSTLVCEAFNGPRPKGKQVAHYDGNSLNDKARNLRWATPKENEADKIRHDTKLRGEKCHGAKLTVGDVRKIKHDLSKGAMQTELAKQYGVSQTAIFYISSGRNWKHVPLQEIASGVMADHHDSAAMDIMRALRDGNE